MRTMNLPDKMLAFVSYSIVAVAVIITLYPFLYVISASISDPMQVAAGKVILWPVGFTLKAFQNVLSSSEVILAFGNSIFYTVAGTLSSITLTLLTAYPLARKEFTLRKFFQVFILVPMFFSGGLIPYFILIYSLKLFDTQAAIILSMLLTPFNIVICRTYLHTIPADLVESARLDGCGEFKILLRIITPVALPIIAVLAIFYGVAYWNNYFYALIFLKSESLKPLQLYLYKILSRSNVESSMKSAGSAERVFSIMQIKYASIAVATLPIIMIYPFLQKYFITGIMIGALKE